VPFAVTLVGGEPLGMLFPQQVRVMAAFGGIGLKEGAELDRRPPVAVEGAAGPGAAR